MKIALLTDGLFPSVMGGMQRHSRALAEQLARQGVNVDTYLPAVGEYERVVHDLKGVANLRLIPVAAPRPRRFPGHYLAEQYELSRSIAARLAESPGADVVYAQGFTGWHLLRGGGARPPVAVNMHGLEMFQRIPQWRSRAEALLLRPAVRQQLNAADAALSFGGGITRLLEGIGVPRERILEVPGALSAAMPRLQPRRPSGRRSMLFVGRNERRKGVPELLRAVELLGHDFPATLTIVGPFDEPGFAHPNTSFHGEITDTAALASLYASADILVCPSYAEGLPMVILEAMACGVAPLATRVGAVDSVVNASNGWLIEPGSAEQLAASIRAACATPDEELYRKKVAARERILQHHTWETVAPKTIAALARLTSISKS